MTTPTTPIDPNDKDALAAALAAIARQEAKAKAKAQKDHAVIAAHHAKAAGLKVVSKDDDEDPGTSGGVTVFKNKKYKAVQNGSTVIVTEKATGTTRTVSMEQWNASGMDPAKIMSGDPLDTTPSDKIKVVNGLGNEVEITQDEFNDSPTSYAKVTSDGQLKLPSGKVIPRHKFNPDRDLGDAEEKKSGILAWLKS